MGRATSKQLAFGRKIAEMLDLEDEFEWLLEQENSFQEVSTFIDENLEEYNAACREDEYYDYIH